MEGCKTCDNYEFGCCDDGLSEATGPDGEVSFKPICFIILMFSSSGPESTCFISFFIGMWL